MSKLQNIKAIKQMLDGNHKFQNRTSVGFSDVDYQKEKVKHREVGEIWEEINAEGKTVCWWEQKDGYRVKYNVDPRISRMFHDIRSELRSFANCPYDTCKCTNPTRLDEKFKKIAGMCHNCVVEYETKLKINGKFKQYAQEKIKNNALSFFQQADKEVEILKNEILSGISYVAGADGNVEKWEVDNKQELIDRITSDYKKLKSDIFRQMGADD